MPNLFSDRPVVIFSWVPASTSGLIRSDTGARVPIRLAISLRSSSSGSDSTLKQLIPSFSPSAISRAVLPTPENTIRRPGTPAASARLSSPSDTTSMPAPLSARVRITAWLEFAFMA